MARILVCGPSLSGKTEIVTKLISENVMFERGINEVLYFSSSGKPNLINAVHFDGIDNLFEVLETRKGHLEHTAIVFDDLQSEAIESSVVNKTWSIYAHHYRIGAVILVMHNLYAKGKFQIDIQRNTSFYIFTKHLRLTNMIKTLSYQLYGDTRLLKIYQLFVIQSKKPYPYLAFNLEARVQELSCYQGLFTHELPQVFITG